MKRTLFVGPYSHHLDSKSSLACYRIVRWITSNVEGCELIQYEDYLKNDCHRNVDNIVYFYSSYYAKFDEIITFFKKHPNAKMFWLYNEYTLALNTSIAKYFKKRGYDVITNLASNHSKEVVSTSGKINVVNTNVSAFRDEIHKKPFTERSYDLIYYGSYKPDRQNYVNEYFQGAYVSTSAKNITRFKMNGLSGTFIDRLVWGRHDSTLNNFKFSVYIEDKSFHVENDIYNHLSDRFYECLSNGVILFFDENCRTNMEKSEYSLPDYFYVSSRNELNEKMKEVENSEKLRTEYFSALLPGIEKEKEALRQEIRRILER